MPFYDYECPACKSQYTELRSIGDRDNILLCEKCAFVCRRKVSRFTVITDTNFWYTDKIDTRLGEKPIQGRKDFWQRVKKQGLREITKRDGPPTTITIDERMKKYIPKAM